MRRLGLAALVLWALVAAAPASTPLRFGRFGAIDVVAPATPGDDVVLLLAGSDRADRSEIARAFAARGALVLALDPAPYLEFLGEAEEPCAYPAGELEELSHFAQQRLGRATYSPPVLAGAGLGATLVIAPLAQAPDGTFRAGLVLGHPRHVYGVRRAMCRGHGPVSQPRPGDAGALEKLRSLMPPVTSLPATADAVEAARALADLLARSRPATLALHADVSDLPLVEVPARSAPAETLAVLLTGDGGWAGLDRGVSAALAARGVGVVGWSSLQYFWTPRTPEDAAEALRRVLAHYTDAWHARRVALIGYSFGADVLPFLASRLPAEQRARIALIALLGPGKDAEFEFHFGDWLGGPARDPHPTAPEVAKLSGLQVLCIYGREERDSLCPELAPGLARRDERPGDHHFDGDYDGLGARIAAAIRGKVAP